MKTIKIDLNNEKQKPGKMKAINLRAPKFKRIKITDNSTRKKKTRRIIFIVLGILLLIPVGYTILFSSKVLRIFKSANINITAKDVFNSSSNEKPPELKKDENGLTNVLLAGIDTRPNDPGLQNTDTVIVATYNSNTELVTMLSIPRDTWAENPKYPGYFTKINAIYNICESYEEGSGLDCLSQVAETITGLEIHYYAMVDIAGLVKIVDTIGGIDVDVENAFTDYMFPTFDNEYETISFEAGLQHMDGTTAMKYARSRHAQSVEGSDFARARRQQKVIIAIKEKGMSSETWLNPLKILEILDSLGDSIKTSGVMVSDIEAAKEIAPKVTNDSIYSMVLDPMAGNWSLITEDPSAAYILIPKAGAANWSEVHTFINFYINNPALCSENATVYVYNGGLGYNETYAKTQEILAAYPYLQITFAGNIGSQAYTGATILSYSEEPKLATLDMLKQTFSQDWTSEIPPELANINGIDIVVILGTPAPAPAPAPATETPAE